METHASFKKIQGTELKVTRNGFFRPTYILSDDLYTYGDITYTGTFRWTSILTIAEDSWTIRRKGIFSRTLLIYNNNAAYVGSVTPEIWNRKIKLIMENGFAADFYNKKILSRTNTWISDQYGDIVSIQTNIWGFKTPFKVVIEPNSLQPVPELPLLTLLGINLVLLKQAQAAQAAH